MHLSSDGRLLRSAGASEKDHPLEYKDYYETLGVAKGSSAQEIQKAYRKLARQYHPDVNKDPNAEARFKEIGEAYEVLKDEDKRQKYDQYGSAWKQAQQGGSPPPEWGGVQFDFGDLGGFGDGGAGQSGFGGGSGFSSFFEMLFGGGGPQPGHGGQTWQVNEAPRGNRRGRDRETSIRLTLEDLATGGKRRIELIDPLTRESRTLEVNVPKGVRPGQKIRLSGQGEPAPRGGQAGDLYLTIEAAPHHRFRLEEDNLVVELPIAPWEAGLGGQVDVPTLGGPVKIKLPAGSSSGKRIRLRGKGMPTKNGTGDLLVELKIVVPNETTDEERTLLEELARVSSFDPRNDKEVH